ncbi:AraC family transcriptional regulator [Ilumatobacter nonamiensis]|uniref:AraC family transcriptional regulator n=1 Tax=Ilumatobacter nonamiensis TaxID=467093 RepID=UPI000348BF0E|nr:helix-turn-helix transcriptional regulator [Ilumatobacter nonamiensis]
MVDVVPVRYRPPDDTYRLDIELVDAPELRARVASNPRRGFERIDFQCFIYVRSGSYSHVVDFETHALAEHSCLMISPGQVHRFGPPSDWTGWMLIVSGHLVADDTGELPAHVRLDRELGGAVTELFDRMEADARLLVDRQRLVQLLALQTAVLVGRLALGVSGTTTSRLADPTLLTRYREYRAAVDDQHRHWHLVTPYARSLGCSAKSLNRACRAIADVSAKDVIVAHIVLEAKRRLALTDDTVAAISRQLGFDEATNFVKYFRRETGTTPTAFRASLQPDS